MIPDWINKCLSKRKIKRRLKKSECKTSPFKELPDIPVILSPVMLKAANLQYPASGSMNDNSRNVG